MHNIDYDLNLLKSSLISGDLSLQEVQRELSRLLFSHFGSLKGEKIAKKIDNEFELVIYTLCNENKIDAAVKLIDEARSYLKTEV